MYRPSHRPSFLLRMFPSPFARRFGISCERRRKYSHTNVSNTLVTRTSTSLARTAHVRFCRRKRVHTQLCSKNHTQALTRRNRGASLRSCAEYLVAALSLKKQPEEAVARLWRVSAFPGTAAPLGCGNLFFCYSVVILHRYQSGQQQEFSIKTIRRPNVHCKTECILLQYSKRSLEWRRYTICPLSSFETTSRK